MPTIQNGDKLHKKTYKDLHEFISEQRDVEKGAIAQKHEKWTTANEKGILNLKVMFQRHIDKAKQVQKVTGELVSWVTLKDLMKVFHIPGSVPREYWSIGYRVNSFGQVQHFKQAVATVTIRK